MTRKAVEQLGRRGKVQIKDLFGDRREAKPTPDSLVKRRVKREENKKRIVIRHKREY